MNTEKLTFALSSLKEAETEILAAQEENIKTLEIIRAAQKEYEVLAIQSFELPE